VIGIGSVNNLSSFRYRPISYLIH